MSLDQVLIDNLDDAGFEALCADIYERLGYKVHNVQHTGDKGRDLIIRSPEGETIVGECKYWAEGSIGRPIVQKLHSAAIDEKAQRALILTTGGTLTKQARDYIDGLPFPIELIDMPKLRDLAIRAGISLVCEEDNLTILCLPSSHSKSLVIQDLRKRLSGQLTSSPASPESLFLESLFKVNRMSIEWTPIYLVQYSIKQEFKTTVGLIHSIDEDNKWIALNGENGTALPEQLAEYIGIGIANLPELDEVFNLTTSLPSKQFNMDASALNESAKERIVERHSKSVGYYGRNNVRYTKRCIPSNRSIYLRGFRQVYIPIEELSIRAMDVHFHLVLINDGESVCYVSYKSSFTCKVCDCGENSGEGTLCNSCGALAHSLYHSSNCRECAFRCKQCSKTICRECAYEKRRFLIFKRTMCYECGNPVGAKKMI